MNTHDDPAETRLSMMAIADVLNDPQVEEYLAGNRHRLATTRAILEMLQLPFPAWAKRSVTGRTDSTRSLMARFHQDNPHQRDPR